MNDLRDTTGRCSYRVLACGGGGAQRGRQRGQSMTEYAVIGGILAAVLFTASSPAGQALTTAIHNFYLDLTFFLSLP